MELSDGPLDRLRHRKQVFGVTDGVNRIFKTFEYRRYSNFTTAVPPLGVWVTPKTTGIPALATISADDPSITGEFTLSVAPADGDLVVATYYNQWFIDTELQLFLKNAARWIGMGVDYANIPDGLIPAALEYACSDAYKKLALKYAERISEIYRLEDAPDPKVFEIVKGYREAADGLLKNAGTLRKQYYGRQDQAEAPLYGAISGRVRDVPPSR